MDLEAMKALPLAELRTLALKQGVMVHHKAGAEKILAAIVDKVTAEQRAKVQKPENSKALEPKEKMPLLSEEEIRVGLARFTEKEAFKIEFHGDDTFTLSCNGAEDSMHMTTPGLVIKRRAEIIAKGARRPRMIEIDGTKVLAT